jgi:hypothetical protein
MILTDYYKGVKDPNTKTRYDVVESTSSYDYFERILINKRNPNKGGLSFYYGNGSGRWGKSWERKSDKKITKASHNISSVIMPDPTLMIGYGDVNHTQDAMIFIISSDWTIIEIFIARGQKNNKLNLFQLTVDKEFDKEIGILRAKAKRLGGNQKSIFDCKEPGNRATV